MIGKRFIFREIKEWRNGVGRKIALTYRGQNLATLEQRHYGVDLWCVRTTSRCRRQLYTIADLKPLEEVKRIALDHVKACTNV